MEREESDNGAAACGAAAYGDADAAYHASSLTMVNTDDHTRGNIPAHLGHVADDGAETESGDVATEHGDETTESATPTADAGTGDDG